MKIDHFEHNGKVYKRTGDKEGSNPGGWFEDNDGQAFYVKYTPRVEGVPGPLRNEFLANKLYQLFDISVPETDLTSVTIEGITYDVLISRKVNNLIPLNSNEPAATPFPVSAQDFLSQLSKGFLVDALLANWDVVGMEFDNVMIEQNGKPVRIDAGGALIYKAQGGKKEQFWEDTVNEYESMRDANRNPQATKLFASATQKKALTDSLKILQNPSDKDIVECVEQYGFDDAKLNQKIAQMLIDRRNNLITKAKNSLHNLENPKPPLEAVEIEMSKIEPDLNHISGLLLTVDDPDTVKNMVAKVGSRKFINYLIEQNKQDVIMHLINSEYDMFYILLVGGIGKGADDTFEIACRHGMTNLVDIALSNENAQNMITKPRNLSRLGYHTLLELQRRQYFAPDIDVKKLIDKAEAAERERLTQLEQQQQREALSLPHQFKQGNLQQVVSLFSQLGGDSNQQKKAPVSGPMNKSKQTQQLESIFSRITAGEIPKVSINEGEVFFSFGNERLNISNIILGADLSQVALSDRLLNDYRNNWLQSKIGVDFPTQDQLKQREETWVRANTLKVDKASYLKRLANINFTHKIALYMYSDEFVFKKINHLLRGLPIKNIDESNAIGVFLATIACIDATNQFPKLDYNAVYRYEEAFDDNDMAKRASRAQNGESCFARGFVSTSVKPCASFKSTIGLTIQNVRGIPIEIYSCIQDEHEVLLPPTSLRYLSYYEEGGNAFYLCEQNADLDTLSALSGETPNPFDIKLYLFVQFLQEVIEYPEFNLETEAKRLLKQISSDSVDEETLDKWILNFHEQTQPVIQAEMKKQCVDFSPIRNLDARLIERIDIPSTVKLLVTALVEYDDNIALKDKSAEYFRLISTYLKSDQQMDVVISLLHNTIKLIDTKLDARPGPSIDTQLLREKIEQTKDMDDIKELVSDMASTLNRIHHKPTKPSTLKNKSIFATRTPPPETTSAQQTYPPK